MTERSVAESPTAKAAAAAPPKETPAEIESRRPEWPDRPVIEKWAFILGAFVFAALALAVALGFFDAITGDLVPTPMWVAMRQIVGGVVVLVALAWLVTISHREAYLAAFWFMAPRLPGLIAAGWLLAYLAPAIPNEPPALPLAVGLWIVLVLWMLLLLPLRRIAEIPTAQPETYRELVTRYNQLFARVTAMQPSQSGADALDLLAPTGNPSLDEARHQLELVRKLLDLPRRGPPGARTKEGVVGGIEWVTSTGYISAWEALNRADEALIDASSVQSAIGEGLHDMLRLSGSQITNASHLQDALRAAVRKFDPEIDRLYFYPQRRRKDEPEPAAATAPVTDAAADAAAPLSEKDAVVMKAVVREVRHAVNVYRTSHASALVRARARLLKAILVTGIAADVLVALAILMEVEPSEVATAAVFFLVGGLVGLFNRLRLEGEGGPAMTSDYGLFDARLLGTLLISGLAGVGGVFLVSAAPVVNVASGAGADSVMSLADVFNLETNRIGLLVAALFGLTPELIVGSLRKQTDALKKELSSTEAAASGSLAAEGPAR
jgi:hypothetical protein